MSPAELLFNKWLKAVLETEHDTRRREDAEVGLGKKRASGSEKEVAEDTHLREGEGDRQLGLRVTFFSAWEIAPAAAAAAAKLLQSCSTLCDPIEGGPPGSPVPGILQAGTLEWAAISFSNA